MFATNDNNVKKKVYIFTGNEREELQGTYHNIGWEIANNWEENLKWEKQGNSLIATAKNGDILIKPVAKNPMDYNPEHKFPESIHKDDYYGRGDGYTSGFGYGDYNSAGISLQALIKNGVVTSDMECIIVSDNTDIDQNKTQFLSDARYFRDIENNAIKDILMRNNNIVFNRFDIGTKQTKEQKGNANHHHSKIENIDILKIVKNIKEHIPKPKTLSNLVLLSSKESLSDAIIAINVTPDIFLNFIIKHNTNKKPIDGQLEGVKFNILKLCYFMADNHLSVLNDAMKNENFKKIIVELDIFSKKIGNKKTYNTYLPISQYINERCSTNKPKKILTPFMDQVFSSPINGTRQYNAELNDFLSFGVDIFDKKHYQDKDSFNLLSNKIDKLIDECDSCFFMPNDFNIRDEFKPVNGFRQKIDLATETNDAVRTFWEQYTLNKAAEKQKGISGICGGHQMIANAMGFFVCRLSAKHLHKELKEKDRAISPTRGGKLADVYSQHTQGVPLSVEAVCREDIDYYNKNYKGGIDAIIEHNNALLKELNLDAGTNNQHSGIVMKDLRLKDDNIRQIISTQVHPENLQIGDDRSQNIMRQFIEKPVVLSGKISNKIADNTQNIINNTGLANNYITMMKKPEDLLNNLLLKIVGDTGQDSSRKQLKRRKGGFKEAKPVYYYDSF